MTTTKKGIEAIRKITAEAPEINRKGPVPNGLNPDDVRAKHHDYTVAIDRLVELEKQRRANELEDHVFEAELRDIAKEYKRWGATPAKLKAKIEARLRPPMDPAAAAARLAEGRGQRDELLEIGCGGEPWHDPDLEAFATIRRDGRRETWKVKSRGYRLYLGAEYRRRYGRVPASQSLSEGIEAIEATARDGAEHEAFVRVAGAADKIYLDLCNPAWAVVEINATGWRVIADPPVYFIRPKGLRPLPEPKRSDEAAGIRMLQGLVNLQGNEFKLYVSWIVAALRPTGPYPVLMVLGEHGTAKSSAVRIARDLVDPGKVKLSGPPRTEQDLAIAALNSRVIAYDNLSDLDGWLADAICRLATGGGLQRRALYTDDDQNLISVCCPVAFTSIPELSSRADLTDRAIIAVPQVISKDRRRDETEFWAAFEDAAPVILGSLLDGVSRALRDYRKQAEAMKEKPRMADFAAWAAAAAPALGWNAAEFLAAYKGNRDEAIEGVLEADVVGEAVIRFSERGYYPENETGTWKATKDGFWENGTWKGTASELLHALNGVAHEEIRKTRGWPKDAARLSGRLRRAAPALREREVMLNFDRGRERGPDGGRKEKRLIEISAPNPDRLA